MSEASNHNQGATSIPGTGDTYSSAIWGGGGVGECGGLPHSNENAKAITPKASKEAPRPQMIHAPATRHAVAIKNETIATSLRHRRRKFIILQPSFFGREE